jgi:hypothetical protein
VLFPDPSPPERLAEIDALVERWLATQREENPAVAATERLPTEPGRTTGTTWYVRLEGEQKATFGVVLTLGQRTLQYETYLMPAPQEQPAELYEHLLRRNRKLYGCQLAIGEEDAIYLVGQLDNRWVDEAELDRILGTLYLATEQFFRPAMRIGFAGAFS